MSKITIASLVASYNVLARTLNEKPLSAKTSIKRDVLIARIDELNERVNASTENVTLVELCRAHNVNAKSVRARFRALYRDDATRATMPVPVARHTYRPCDVPALMPYITRS